MLIPIENVLPIHASVVWGTVERLKRIEYSRTISISDLPLRIDPDSLTYLEAFTVLQ